MDFEDVRLCDLLDRVKLRAEKIASTRSVSEFKSLGQDIQNVYDFFVTAEKPFEQQQDMLKNLFSSFNYAAVIINDGIKKKTLDKEAVTLLNECLEIITACCNNIKSSFSSK